MTTAIFAAQIGQWSLVQVVITIIVIAAVVAIMYVALRQFGITIPPWVIQIFWIVVVAAVAIVAIKFLITLW